MRNFVTKLVLAVFAGLIFFSNAQADVMKKKCFWAGNNVTILAGFNAETNPTAIDVSYVAGCDKWYNNYIAEHKDANDPLIAANVVRFKQARLEKKFTDTRVFAKITSPGVDIVGTPERTGILPTHMANRHAALKRVGLND